jgi:glycosyltransferase involved in cell wall biosynthesis
MGKDNLIEFEPIPDPPQIDPVPDGVARPLFSVMIPVCNRIKFLRQTIESVLNENYPPEQMQICIVENSTEKIDWESLLTPEEARRIEIFRQSEHVGMAENWNTCIRQARGQLVHILHDDDWILCGFYQEIKRLSESHPLSALIATRNVFVDESGTWNFLSAVMDNHKSHSTCNKDFYFETPIQCGAIVIRREFYENFGGFFPNLIFAPDWEMWNRATRGSGAVISNKALAIYRMFDGSATGSLALTAENLKDMLRVTQIFAQEVEEYPYEEAIQHLIFRASKQAKKFRSIGNLEAAKAAEDFAEALSCTQKPMPSGLAWFLYGFSNFLRRQADKIYLKN